MPEFEFISPDCLAALFGLSSPDYAIAARIAAADLGYKTHETENHAQFLERFNQAPYELVLLEENFDPSEPGSNPSLAALQNMQMSRRRHATIVLFGDSFETLNAMQAYQQSVHAVVNRRDLDKLGPILQQVLNSNEQFLSVFKDAQSRMTQGKR
jgi:hypothetical protein